MADPASVGSGETHVLTPDLWLRVVRVVRRAGWCENCRATGTFDHSSGAGSIPECIYDDPALPPHRYCPCKVCGGTGLDPEIMRLLDDLGTI